MKTVRRLLAGVASAGLLFAGCAAPPAIWEVSAPTIEGALHGIDAGPAAARGLRFLVPYPVPVEDGIALVACRFAGGNPSVSVDLQLDEAGDREARDVLESIEDGLSSLRLDVVPQAEMPAGPVGIRIREASGMASEGPRGLGDTLATCEIPEQGSMEDRENAFLVGAEVTMRRTLENAVEVQVAVLPEEWAGALAHEMGHALGFQGHVRRLRSPMSLDQDHLRRIGRSIRAGRRVEFPALSGLYALESGQHLGARALSETTLVWQSRIEAVVAGQPHRRFSRVGDRGAELEWRLENGPGFFLRFPYWVEQLESRAALLALPTRETRRLLDSTGGLERTIEPGN